ncbi:aminotransferase class I/II-fold pyridoxal phosphate-dependent enzyme [Mycolicibacterium brisbanense]|uniref:Orn/Lys/Arg decarboxylase major region n=1 Tax=Mycolicibacterium brisbanense TaxID=146020 RepID=A0A100VUD8_9MYCO|nr:aminotransferase class V-fold PLP-dependent enzyme [Mycolicibacterium brisbanense]MCV7156972.1 aminotransferase class V-fold PLP-dependent enzyme [Mycolicibacterium brisbanense]GAS86053.1 Orn/Lys/Arg decarboxylase major region [Mycolicibacterium brisbanense]
MTDQTFAEMSQAEMPYTDAIRRYADLDYVRLDVPGHCGSALAQPELAELFGERVLQLDLPPLVDGIDQGTVPTPLQQSARLAADAWGARRTWLVTNGASKGNLVACLALRHLGEHIVVQRTMHSSVMDGMVLGGLIGHYVQPDIDSEIGAAHGLHPDALDAALDAHPEAVAAYLVTPSYFGAVADVPALARVAHDHGVVLVVDQAWAAHFGFHPDLPANALSQGADLVISSTHKLGGSLTQSAMLHLGEGPHAEVLEPLVNRAFRSMQSTSASSLLMMSLDVARHALAVHGRERIRRSLDAAAELRAGLAAEGRFADLSERFRRSPAVVDIDPLRIAIDTRAGGISGHAARQLLFHDHHIHTEMATDSAVVAVIGAGSAPDVPRVLAALHALPDQGAANSPLVGLPESGPTAMTLRQAYFAPAELVPACEAVGRISADSLAAYPPGIPNVLPGEILTDDVVNFLRTTANSPFGHVRGAADPSLDHIRVLTQR